MNLLLNHIKISDDLRDLQWEQTLLELIKTSKVTLLSEEPQNGPDSWPYLLVSTQAESQEPFNNMAKWLSTRGIGLVLNPTQSYPDYVFNYGMLWYYCESGSFTKSQVHPTETGEVMSPESFQIGELTSEFIPVYVRKVISEFLLQQGVLLAKAAVVCFDKVTLEFCVSLESLGNPPKQEHQGIAEAIAWFLPPHIPVVLMSELNRQQYFTPLSS